MNGMFSRCLDLAKSQKTHWLELLLVFAVVMATRFIGGLVLNRTGMLIDPDVYEFQYLADRLASTGQYGFASDWQDNPWCKKSAWKYLYDNTGSLRAPGYPAALAVADTLLGPADRARDILLAFAEGLTAVMAFLIGAFLFGALGGRIAACLYIINPASVQCILWGGRESLVSLLFALGLYLTLKATRGSRWYAVAAGLVLGLGSCFKDTLIAVAALAAVWFVFQAIRRKPGMFVRGTLIGIFAILAWLPWVVRNSLAYHQWAGMSTAGGLAVWHGVLDREWPYDARGKTDYIAGFSPEDRARLDPATATNALEADKRFMQIVRIRAPQDPAGVAKAMIRNVGLYWSPVSKIFMEYGLKRRPQELISMAYYGPFFILALTGLWMFRKKPHTGLAILLLVGLTALHSVTFSAPRFRIVFDMLPLVFAAGAIAAFLQRQRPQERHSGAGDPAT